mgnify:CR=1 FL=1
MLKHREIKYSIDYLDSNNKKRGEEPCIVSIHSDGSRIFRATSKIFDSEIIRDVIYTDSNSTAAHCIKAGLGVAIMPESVAVDQKLFFRLLSKPSLTREIHLINRNENTYKNKIDNQILKSALWL